ncbi:MAG: nickel-dependent lactate racemase [Candidatus Bathyarchaeia archaeon]
MVEVWLPYGNSEVPVRIKEENLIGIFNPKEAKIVENIQLEIKNALENPIGTEKLSKLLNPKSKVAIVVNDFFQIPFINLILESTIEQIKAGGIKDENISIIVATSYKKSQVNEKSLYKVFNANLLNKFKIFVHDCNSKDLVYLGETSFKNKLYLNKEFMNSDFKILVGKLSFHYFSGYGGCVKSIIPGISAIETIKHNYSMITNENCKPGLTLENPVFEESFEASKTAGVNFIINVVLNSKKDLLKVFAGDFENAFFEGIKFLDEICKVKVEKKADIAIISAGGNPYDLTFDQASKCLQNIIDSVNENGVIILLAECSNGYGDEVFFNSMKKFKNSFEEFKHEIKKRFVIGYQKAYFLIKSLEKFKIYLVSTLPDYYVSKVFGLKPFITANSALQSAIRYVGKDSKVLVSPIGNSMLIMAKA